jgi:glycerol dehydrogenase-like iron-containing ADH family enzyme
VLVIKFVNNKIKENNILGKMIQNLSGILKKDGRSELSLVRDKNSVEMVSGNLSSNNDNDDDIIVELTIKKQISLKEHELLDRERLDKLVKEIAHFCEQSAEIKELKYLPINFR